ncbi:MAG TPA: LysR family transcriptional regulator [Candidatus Acidoferrales bacterium]|nr:LysR family transcriptional regulator [Candidatus Acidoferrales bacterium]
MRLNDLDLNKLHTFFAVAEHQGITRAAARLGLTRAAVSQSVSTLEAALNVRLFHRIGKRMSLTNEGRLLHARLRDYQAQLQQTLDAIVNEERTVRGVVRIGLFLGFSRLRLSGLLARFTGRYPEARVKLLYAPHSELNAHLLNDRVDFVFSLSPQHEGGAKIRSSRLLRQELVLAGAQQFFKRPFGIDDLKRMPVIDYYQSDPLIHRWVRHHYRVKPPDLRVTVWAATTDLVLELLLNRAGIGVLPRDLADPFVKRRRLFIVDTGRPELSDFIWLNELMPTFPNPLLDAFRAVVHEEFSPA